MFTYFQDAVYRQVPLHAVLCSRHYYWIRKTIILFALLKLQMSPNIKWRRFIDVILFHQYVDSQGLVEKFVQRSGFICYHMRNDPMASFLPELLICTYLMSFPIVPLVTWVYYNIYCYCSEYRNKCSELY